MRSLLEPPPVVARRESRAAAERATVDTKAVDRAIDLTLHAATLAVRIAVYAVSATLLASTTFGPHFLLGMLLGDFLGSAVMATKAFRNAPLATGAELSLFVVLLTITAWQWNSTTTPELRALMTLTAFAALAARVGWAFGNRDDTVL
ncbi:MAG: hypothetical protein ABL997_19810 [Planctomycetota bacterium]